MRASQILTEKSINEKLEYSIFSYKFLLFNSLQAFFFSVKRHYLRQIIGKICLFKASKILKFQI